MARILLIKHIQIPDMNTILAIPSLILKGLFYILMLFLMPNFYAEEGYRILIETSKSALI